MYRLSAFWPLFLLYLSYTTVWANDTAQISYLLAREGTLTIHLPPKGALDLVQYLKPALETEPVVKWNDHYPAFNKYFNQTIDLKIKGEGVRFRLQQVDLNQDDTIMVFEMVKFPGNYEQFEISLNSFTEVYKRVTNQVIIELPSGQQVFILKDDQITCSYDQVVVPQLEETDLAQHQYQIYLWLGGFFLLAAILFWFSIFRYT